MIADPGVSLDNTVWKGTETNTITGTTKAFQMSFKPGNLVEIKNGNTVLGIVGYSRYAAGAAIRITGGFFSVLVSGGEMRGSDGNAAFPWQAIKQ